MNQRIFPERISKRELQELPLISFRGDIHVISKLKEVPEALEALSSVKLLGFDTETRPAFHRGISNPVALVQLSGDSEVFLFRLREVGLPRQLIDLMENPSILKVGLAIHDDIRALQENRNFEPRGFIDLANIARELGIVTTGLRNLSGIVLGARISKRFQLSNWERKTLDENQKIYAATDAWVCREIYHRLKEEGFLQEDESPDLPPEKPESPGSVNQNRMANEHHRS